MRATFCHIWSGWCPIKWTLCFLYPSLVLVQPRKTERLLMGSKESNLKNKKQTMLLWVNPCPAKPGYVIFRKECRWRISWLNLVNPSVDRKSRSALLSRQHKIHLYYIAIIQMNWLETELNVPYHIEASWRAIERVYLYMCTIWLNSQYGAPVNWSDFLDLAAGSLLSVESK